MNLISLWWIMFIFWSSGKFPAPGILVAFRTCNTQNPLGEYRQDSLHLWFFFKSVLTISDVQTTEIVSVALKFLQVMNNKYFCSERWMPAHRHCFFFYLFDACREQKPSSAGEWAPSLRKKERSLCKHHWRKRGLYIYV